MKGKLLSIFCCAAALQVQARPQVSILLNQVGYAPEQEKTVVVEGMNPNGKLTVTDAGGQVVAKGKAARKARSPWSKKVRYVVDLTDVTTPGTYTLSVGNATAQMTVAASPWSDLTAASLKFFYLMRTGMPIEAAYAGRYARPAGHADTHVLIHPSAATEGRPAGSVISSPLGWYDAGDYNKYIVNSSFSIGLMLAAYGQNSNGLSHLDVNIPESGNATPDFLDEMMFNLRWMMTMQDPADGGVYHKLTTPNFEGFVMPADCQQPRYVVAKTTPATLDFAAVMAQAARIYRGCRDYPEFATQAEAAARSAYEWACRHPSVFYRQGAMNEQFQPAVNTGAYDDEDAADEWFWAATELYLLTGDEVYIKEVRARKPQQFTIPTWGNVAGLGAYEWMVAGQAAGGAADVRASMVNQLKAYADELVARVATSNFQAPFGDRVSDFGWGCMAEGCCGQAIALAFADRQFEGVGYRRYALQNVDYMLGRNATGYCYVTGFGQKSPLHPHHRLSAADGIDAPFPGMLVGGPNPGQQDKSSYLTYPSSFPDESYVDSEASYASNEIAINWNASLVALLGLLGN